MEHLAVLRFLLFYRTFVTDIQDDFDGAMPEQCL
jgi:hypothetical protein